MEENNKSDIIGIKKDIGYIIGEIKELRTDVKKVIENEIPHLQRAVDNFSNQLGKQKMQCNAEYASKESYIWLKNIFVGAILVTIFLTIMGILITKVI